MKTFVIDINRNISKYPISLWDNDFITLDDKSFPENYFSFSRDSKHRLETRRRDSGGYALARMQTVFHFSVRNSRHYHEQIWLSALPPPKIRFPPSPEKLFARIANRRRGGWFPKEPSHYTCILLFSIRSLTAARSTMHQANSGGPPVLESRRYRATDRWMRLRWDDRWMFDTLLRCLCDFFSP